MVFAIAVLQVRVECLWHTHPERLDRGYLELHAQHRRTCCEAVECFGFPPPAGAGEDHHQRVTGSPAGPIDHFLNDGAHVGGTLRRSRLRHRPRRHVPADRLKGPRQHAEVVDHVGGEGRRVVGVLGKDIEVEGRGVVGAERLVGRELNRGGGNHGVPRDRQGGEADADDRTAEIEIGGAIRIVGLRPLDVVQCGAHPHVQGRAGLAPAAARVRVRRIHVVGDRVGARGLEAATQHHRALDEKGHVGEDDQEQRDNVT
jgi:hypothetical protein